MRTLSLLLVLTLAGCASSPVEVHATQGKRLTMAVGQQLAVTLGNVGPGEYAAPAVSSGVVRYLGVTIVPPYLPSGPTQQFLFTAVAPGQALITFRSSGSGPVVADTVTVTCAAC